MRNSTLDEGASEIAVALDTARLVQIATIAVVSAAIGIGIGLIVAWTVWPVEYVNADLSDLRQRHKDDYVRMIAAAYVMDGNVTTAQARLNQVNRNFSAKSISDLLIREQKSGRDVPTLNALALFAQGMGFGSLTLPAPTGVAETIISNNTSKPAPPIPGYQIAERVMFSCEDQNQARLQFIVRDVQGKETSNVPIEIHWANGEDIVYTGLKPERGIGYADFEATPGTYSVTIANAQGETAEGLNIGEPPVNCKNDRGQTPRGWKLIFRQR